MSKKLTTKEWKQRAQYIHGEKYDYSKVVYHSINTKVCIICPTHGEFWQKPNNHVSGKCGCPKCNESKGERQIRLWLEQHNFQYKYQKRFILMTVD